MIFRPNGMNFYLEKTLQKENFREEQATVYRLLTVALCLIGRGEWEQHIDMPSHLPLTRKRRSRPTIPPKQIRTSQPCGRYRGMRKGESFFITSILFTYLGFIKMMAGGVGGEVSDACWSIKPKRYSHLCTLGKQYPWVLVHWRQQRLPIGHPLRVACSILLDGSLSRCQSRIEIPQQNTVEDRATGKRPEKNKAVFESIECVPGRTDCIP